MAKRYIGDAVINITYRDRGDYAGTVRVGNKTWRFEDLRAPPAGLGVASDSPEAYDRMASSAVSFGSYYTTYNRGEDTPDWAPPADVADAIDDAVGWASDEEGRGLYEVRRSPGGKGRFRANPPPAGLGGEITREMDLGPPVKGSPLLWGLGLAALAGFAWYAFKPQKTPAKEQQPGLPPAKICSFDFNKLSSWGDQNGYFLVVLGEETKSAPEWLDLPAWTNAKSQPKPVIVVLPGNDFSFWTYEFVGGYVNKKQRDDLRAAYCNATGTVAGHPINTFMPRDIPLLPDQQLMPVFRKPTALVPGPILAKEPPL